MKKILFLVLLISTLSLSAASPCGIWDKTINAVTNAGNNIDCAVHTLNAKGACPGCTLIGITKDAIKLAPGIKITDLSGAQLRYVNFANFDFGNAKLDGANLVGANLEGATFSGSLLGTNLSSAHLKGARLEHATLGNDVKGASLYGADLTGAFFTNNQTINHVGFAGAKISGTDFSGAKIQNLVGELKDDISHETFGTKYTTGLAGPGVTYLDFRGAKNLDKAIFTHAHMPMLNLSNMTGRKSLNLPNFTGANLTGADFSGSTIVSANFRGGVLDSANFSGEIDGKTKAYTEIGGKGSAVVFGKSMAGANFNITKIGLGVDMSFIENARGASFRHAKIDSASLARSNFSGSDFSAATFTNVNCWATHFDGCKFINASITGGHSQHTTFNTYRGKDADLYGVTLHSNFEDAHFIGASLARAKLGNPKLSRDHDHNTFINIDFNNSNLVDAYLYGLFHWSSFRNVGFQNTTIDSKDMARVSIGPSGSSWNMKNLNFRLRLDADFTGASLEGFKSFENDPVKALDSSAWGCYKNKLFMLAMCKVNYPGACSAYCNSTNDYFSKSSVGSTCFNSNLGDDGFQYSGNDYSSSQLNKCAYFDSEQGTDKDHLSGFITLSKCTQADLDKEPYRQHCSDVVSKTAAGTRDTVKWTKHTVSTGYDKTKKWLDSVF